MQLTVVDTPGFGDNIDNTDSWNAVIQNIEAKFEDYLNAESRVNRTAVQDTRVHCCLYFIAPTGNVCCLRYLTLFLIFLVFLRMG